MNRKFCSRCSQHKYLIDFHRCRGVKSQLQVWCKDCMRELSNSQAAFDRNKRRYELLKSDPTYALRHRIYNRENQRKRYRYDPVYRKRIQLASAERRLRAAGALASTTQEGA